MLICAMEWRGCFYLAILFEPSGLSLVDCHLEGKSGRKKVGPAASQEVEGRVERMEERKGEWRERRREGMLSSMWSLVTRVTRGEEERREGRDSWEEENRYGSEGEAGI